MNDTDVAYIDISLPLNAAITTEVLKIEFRCRSSADPVRYNWSAGDEGVVKFEISGNVPDQSSVASAMPMNFGRQNDRALYWHVAVTKVNQLKVVQYMVMRAVQ